jgi:hypothetical protein
MNDTAKKQGALFVFLTVLVLAFMVYAQNNYNELPKIEPCGSECEQLKNVQIEKEVVLEQVEQLEEVNLQDAELHIDLGDFDEELVIETITGNFIKFGEWLKE